MTRTSAGSIGSAAAGVASAKQAAAVIMVSFIAGLRRSRLPLVAYSTPQFFWVDTFPKRYVVDEIEQESINDR
jgi:hypothetical protein